MATENPTVYSGDQDGPATLYGLPVVYDDRVPAGTAWISPHGWPPDVAPAPESWAETLRVLRLEDGERSAVGLDRPVPRCTVTIVE